MQGSSIIGNNILKLNAVDSTNTYAMALLKKQKLPEGMIIQAFEQTAGRGQMGTNWHSLPGESLTFSVILTPEFLPVHKQFYLSMAVSLALYDYLRTKGLSSVVIKWPNDIIVDRRKIAGILIETSLKGETIQHAVVGIGLNINSNPDELSTVATSLLAETGRIHDLEAELHEVCQHLDTYYALLKTGKFEKLKQEYMSKLLGVGQPIQVVRGNTKTLVKVIDIKDSGKVVLEEINGNWWVAGFKEFEWTY